MFGKKVQGASQGSIDSLIGAGTQIEGNIFFSGGLRIDGEVLGNVQAAGDAAVTLVISEKARIRGEVNVSHLVMNGCIEGRVRVTDSLEMESRARIVGDVEYQLIEMHQGAVIEGHLLPRGKKIATPQEQNQESTN